jgi:hypothetical protein
MSVLHYELLAAWDSTGCSPGATPREEGRNSYSNTHCAMMVMN